MGARRRQAFENSPTGAAYSAVSDHFIVLRVQSIAKGKTVNSTNRTQHRLSVGGFASRSACAAVATLPFLLVACGGGGSATPVSNLVSGGGTTPVVTTPTAPPSTPPSTTPTVVTTPAGTPTAVVTPPAVAATTCYDGKVANTVGADDPFYVNAWHLKNTGPTQVVSATSNKGVAGIDANVEAVHQGGLGCTGKGVTIAIVDSALELGHEDLKDNVVAGKSWNFKTNTDDTNPPAKQIELDHGTGVAGVAVARGWNGKGTRGTAPFASVVAYPTLSVTPAAGTTKADMMILAFGAKGLADATKNVTKLFGTRADATGIFNYSVGADYAAPPVVEDLEPSELAAQYGTRTLRGGLGAVYFQSAGNEYTSMTGQLPDGTTMKVNCPQVLAADATLLGGVLSNLAGMSCGNPNHEPNGKPYFYQVASLGNKGVASSYSSSGAANWISGFGGENGIQEAAIISTDDSGCLSGANNTDNGIDLALQAGEVLPLLIADLMGAPGSKDPGCNYTGQMNGTSAAAPSVSGVVALLLEANPKLTWQDVGYILAKTARKVDAGIATGAKAVTYTPTGATAGWALDEPWLTNAAGFNFQNRYGFGMVDANAATKLAVAYTTPAGRRATELKATGAASTASRVKQAGLNTAIASFGSTTAVSGQMRVDLTVTNKTDGDINPGTLQFEITNSVTGTKSILLPAFTSWYAGGKTFKIKPGAQQQFRFHTNAFFGENLGGTYTVNVVDFLGASGTAGKSLSFAPTLTAYSL
jgi:subtilisin family serine protease